MKLLPLFVMVCSVLLLVACNGSPASSSEEQTDAELAQPADAEQLQLSPQLMLATMPGRTGVVTLRGNPVTLLGEGVTVGEPAPDFVVVDGDMNEVSLSDYRGKTVVLSVVPSVDTKVCATQTRTFNQEASDLGEDVVVLTVSMDLPMAQKRFCAAEGIERVVTLSDYRYWSLGTGWGLRIKENGLLARSIYVIDPQGKLVYEQIVPELTTEPNYAAALAAARNAAG